MYLTMCLGTLCHAHAHASARSHVPKSELPVVQPKTQTQVLGDTGPLINTMCENCVSEDESSILYQKRIQIHFIFNSFAIHSKICCKGLLTPTNSLVKLPFMKIRNPFLRPDA